MIMNKKRFFQKRKDSHRWLWIRRDFHRQSWIRIVSDRESGCTQIKISECGKKNWC